MGTIYELPLPVYLIQTRSAMVGYELVEKPGNKFPAMTRRAMARLYKPIK